VLWSLSEERGERESVRSGAARGKLGDPPRSRIPCVIRRVGLLCAVLLAAGCGTRFEAGVAAADRAVLAAPEALELFALSPFPSAGEEPLAPDEEGFHGYRVLGRTRVHDAEARAELLGLVRRGIDASDGAGAACFLPRHGLRAERGGSAVDLVLCYECLRARIYGARPEPWEVLTASTVEPEVSAFFRAQGLELDAR
jgi:hypothetical protein